LGADLRAQNFHDPGIEEVVRIRIGREDRDLADCGIDGFKEELGLLRGLVVRVIEKLNQLGFGPEVGGLRVPPSTPNFQNEKEGL
jgi:hypothetical protein